MMEHNNHTEWHDDRLNSRLEQLRAIDQPWQGSEERRTQIRREIDVVMFEINARYCEAHSARVADAYDLVQQAYDNIESLKEAV